jgi:hypothetical protein
MSWVHAMRQLAASGRNISYLGTAAYSRIEHPVPAQGNLAQTGRLGSAFLAGLFSFPGAAHGKIDDAAHWKKALG